MQMLEDHSKLVIVGVEGKNQGFSLALAALCDVLLASEDASFAISENRNAILYPGSSVLTSRGLPQNLVSYLFVPLYFTNMPCSSCLCVLFHLNKLSNAGFTESLLYLKHYLIATVSVCLLLDSKLRQ